jgi:plasmid stability protein
VATLIVRQVDERLVRSLKERAERHGRSAEAEHRALLEAALGRSAPSASELLTFFREGAELGFADAGIEAPLPSGPVTPVRLGADA